jgi:hypothetical protein
VTDKSTDLSGSITDKHIDLFQSRATLHFRISYVIIFVIFLLFVSAGALFLLAQNIDKGKGQIDFFRQIEIAKKDQQIVIDKFEIAKQGTQEEHKVGQRTVKDILDAWVPLGEAKTTLLVLEEKDRLMTEAGYFADIDQILSREEISAQKKGLADLESELTEFLKKVGEEFDKGELTRTDVAEAEAVLGQITLKREIVDEKLKSAIPAKQLKVAATNLDTLDLIRTSLVRFGGVAVILFLISTLVPIYRYNVRLATYYLARADTLILCRDAKVSDFSAMIKLLTPTHAFEKEPTTPVETVASLVKEAAGAAKGG